MKIHECASNCDAEGVRAEIARGVAVDSRDERDFTPLAYAVANPSMSLELLALLVDNGADVNAAIENEKSCPLCLSAEYGNFDSFQFLLDAGAVVDAPTANGYTALIKSVFRLHNSESLVPTLEVYVKHGANLNCESDYGERPITVASHLGRFDAVRTLVNAGADSTLLKWSELATAVAIGTNDDVARVLVSKGLDSDPDCYGRTPGILAAIAGTTSKGKLLASYGWNVNERVRNQETALVCCASKNHYEMLSWLLKEGADIDAVDDSRNSALFLAAQAGSGECVKLLLDAGANVRLVNTYGETAMSNAASVEVVRQLQAAGEDLNLISDSMKRELTGLSGFKSLDCSPEEYQAGKQPRAGRSNPEEMCIPFWRAMVQSGCYAYPARKQYDDTHEMNSPVWCFARFGCSFTELPDGRFVQVGGEHEDSYDPDFCIYNDVIVHTAPGEFTIYGYPKDVFQPTDFHTATYVDGFLYIVGCLGYQGTRVFGTTPVYRISCEDWKIETVPTRGANPGWLYKHGARLVEPGILVVSGGTVALDKSGAEVHEELQGSYSLNLLTMTWEKITDK
jgi:ankyrin repeat protein